VRTDWRSLTSPPAATGRSWSHGAHAPQQSGRGGRSPPAKRDRVCAECEVVEVMAMPIVRVTSGPGLIGGGRVIWSRAAPRPTYLGATEPGP
jgi:hypothetical protein